MPTTAACTLQRTGMWHCLHFAPGPSEPGPKISTKSWEGLARRMGICVVGLDMKDMIIYIYISISWIVGYSGRSTSHDG